MADDCWAATERNATGYPYPEVDHFPNGMKQVIDYVHSKYKVDPADHLVFGLYTCGGKKTCVGGRVGSEDFWEKDAAAYAEWGVDWVKMDWVSPPPPPPPPPPPLLCHISVSPFSPCRRCSRLDRPCAVRLSAARPEGHLPEDGQGAERVRPAHRL